MIAGSVSTDYEAIVILSIRGSSGQKQDINFVVDTGFNGALTLPLWLIVALDLVLRTSTLVSLANGAQERVNVYTAFIVWDGYIRPVYVEEANTDPLLGMALLRNHDLFMEGVIGGIVTITARP